MINLLTKPKLFTGGLLLVALFLGAWWFWNNGYVVAESKNTTVALESQEQAVKVKERVRHEEQALNDDAIDIGLRDLGIMRRDEDR